MSAPTSWTLQALVQAAQQTKAKVQHCYNQAKFVACILDTHQSQLLQFESLSENDETPVPNPWWLHPVPSRLHRTPLPGPEPLWPKKSTTPPELPPARGHLLRKCCPIHYSPGYHLWPLLSLDWCPANLGPVCTTISECQLFNTIQPSPRPHHHWLHPGLHYLLPSQHPYHQDLHASLCYSHCPCHHGVPSDAPPQTSHPHSATVGMDQPNFHLPPPPQPCLPVSHLAKF